jgi:hypothetical protein
MTRSYYDLLGVGPTAPADEVKRAFRREIAKYHPDKVQHLGREFQEIAAVKAAELTQAYKTLSDEALRADYDAELLAPADAARAAQRPEPPSPHPPPAATVRPVPSPPPAPDPDRPDRRTRFSTERAGATDLLRRAAIARFRHALDAELGRCEETPVRGFEIACTPPKGRFWNKLAPHVLARVVPHVDAAAVSESWDLASRMKRDEQRDICVFLMGPDVAPLPELARAIAEEWRRPRAAGAKLYLIPVNTRSWAAHIPNDAPPVVKSLVTRLKSS